MKRSGGTLFKDSGGNVVESPPSSEGEETTNTVTLASSVNKPNRPIYRAKRQASLSNGTGNSTPSSSLSSSSLGSSGTGGLFKNVQLLPSSSTSSSSTNPASTVRIPSSSTGLSFGINSNKNGTTNTLTPSTTVASRLPLSSSSLSFGSIGGVNNGSKDNNNGFTIGEEEGENEKNNNTNSSASFTGLSGLPKPTLSFGTKTGTVSVPVTSSSSTTVTTPSSSSSFSTANTATKSLTFGKKPTLTGNSSSSSNTGNDTVVPTPTATTATPTFRFGKGNTTTTSTSTSRITQVQPPSFSTSVVVVPSSSVTPKVPLPPLPPVTVSEGSSVPLLNMNNKLLSSSSKEDTFRMQNTTTTTSTTTVPSTTPSSSTGLSFGKKSKINDDMTGSFSSSSVSTTTTTNTIVPNVPSSTPGSSSSSVSGDVTTASGLKVNTKPVAVPELTSSSSSLSAPIVSSNMDDRRKTYLRKLIAVNKGYASWIQQQNQNPVSLTGSWVKEAQLYVNYVTNIEKEYQDILTMNNGGFVPPPSSSLHHGTNTVSTSSSPSSQTNGSGLKFSFSNLQPNSDTVMKNKITSTVPSSNVKVSSNASGPLKFSFNASSTTVSNGSSDNKVEKEEEDNDDDNNVPERNYPTASTAFSSTPSATATGGGIKFSFQNMKPTENSLSQHVQIDPSIPIAKPRLGANAGPAGFSFGGRSKSSVSPQHTELPKPPNHITTIAPAPAPPVSLNEPPAEKKAFVFGKLGKSSSDSTGTGSSVTTPSTGTSVPSVSTTVTNSTEDQPAAKKFTFGTKRKEMESVAQGKNNSSSTMVTSGSTANEDDNESSNIRNNPTNTNESNNEPATKRTTFSFGRKPDPNPAFGPRKDRTLGSTTTDPSAATGSKFNPVESTTNSKKEEENNDDEDEDENTFENEEKPSLLLPTETIMYEVTARLHRLGEKSVVANASKLSESDIKAGNYERVVEKTWLNMDVGQLRILKDSASQKSRIIFSPPNSSRPVLNALLGSNSKISLIPKDPKANDSKVRLDCFLLLGSVLNRYQITVKTSAQANELLNAFTMYMSKKI